MKIQPDKMDVQAITAYGDGWIAIDHTRHTQSVLLGSDGLLQDWDCQHFQQLQAQHLAQLAALDYELLILGCGRSQHFVPVAWQQPLLQRRMGLECMTTAAACRTYNILACEGRRVLAALMV